LQCWGRHDMNSYMIFLVTLLSIGFFFYPKDAWAYIDPGTGGYLISSIIAGLGAFFAFASAFCIHFFRNIIWRSTVYLWRRHRSLFLLGIFIVLAGLGFLIFSAFYEPPVARFDPALSGPHTLDPARVSPGYDLYEGKLMDNQGHVVKKWSSIYLGTIDKNGDYYAEKYFEAPLWGRYTWDDKVVWEKHFPIHHELLLTPQGTIITFTKEVHQYNGRDVEFDVVLEYDKDGHELQRYSFWDHLAEFQQFHKKLELDMPASIPIPQDHRMDKSVFGGHYDYYHLNSLSIVPSTPLESRHPAFQPGNWLLSFRHGSMVFILGKDKHRILWRAIYDQVKDKLEGPHAPSMLANGNILLLDNGRYRKWSRLLELDPVTLKVVWEYRDKNFYSLSQGYAQQLPNGNVLVTEAEEGHVFELTPDKKVVWEFYHPDRQNEKNSTDKKKWGLRQEIYRMTRYPADMIDPLLK